MHPRQASLLATTDEIADKIAAKKPVALATPLLWKYVDPESGKEFFLTERKTPVKSPYSGKSISVRPEKMTVPAVGKDLKEDAGAAASGAPGPKAAKPKKASDWKA